MSRLCKWCRVELGATRSDAQFCGKRCRQNHWRVAGPVASAGEGFEDRELGAGLGYPVAALFVRPDGHYPSLASRWFDLERDARTYDGPLPVVAHPPCARWGRYATVGGRKLGDDDGCGASAVASVRRWGGVLEHPMASRLWDAFDLPRPGQRDDWGFAIFVRQEWWGHPTVKPTWVYVAGLQGPIPKLPAARRPRGDRPRPLSNCTLRQRELSPEPFAMWLCELASRCATRRPVLGGAR